MAKQTPSQTVGPFFSYGLTPEAFGKAGVATNTLADGTTPGEHIRIEGQVLDGAGQPIGDALVEIWQANSNGRYRHPADRREEHALDPGFLGFGRAATDEDGTYRFVTVKPGPVPGRGNAPQAPHLSVIVFARGVLSHAYTRCYFSDESEANAIDPTLSSVEASRRATLIAIREESPAGPVYRMDIRMQGDRETVFFDV